MSLATMAEVERLGTMQLAIGVELLQVVLNTGGT